MKRSGHRDATGLLLAWLAGARRPVTRACSRLIGIYVLEKNGKYEAQTSVAQT